MVTDPQPPQGRLVDDRYRLGAVLGSGGMATVHRAWDTRLERAVALKLYRPNADRGAQQRFREEARTLAGLTHPGLVAVYDFGTDDGEPYLVLQLVDGETLRDRMGDGPMCPREVRELGARLAATLAHVHACDVIHRDIKPSNVLLDHDGAPYLADFGVSLLAHAARLTATGEVLGTAAYLAPEQVLGRHIDPAVDVYALGLVLLECLTGRTEYDGGGVETAVARLYREPRIPADTPPELASLLAAMTRLDPATRPTAATCAATLAHPATVSAPSAAVPFAGPAVVAGAAPVNGDSPVAGSTPPAAGSLHRAARRSVTRVLAALPLASATPTAARPVPTGRRLPALAAAATLVVAAMTWTVLASATPSSSTPGDTTPTERSQVGVVPARQPVPTTTPPQQVITEIVTVVVPQPAEQPAPAAPKGKGKKPKGDDDEDD